GVRETEFRVRRDREKHMVSQTASNFLQPSATGRAPAAAIGDAGGAALSLELLENVAARFRPSGLLLAVFRSDGTLMYSAPEAAGFFQWYVLPALQQHQSSSANPPARPITVVQPSNGPAAHAAPQAIACREAPGVVLAGFTYAERRHAAGMVVLAARGE